MKQAQRARRGIGCQGAILNEVFKIKLKCQGESQRRKRKEEINSTSSQEMTEKESGIHLILRMTILAKAQKRANSSTDLGED